MGTNEGQVRMRVLLEAASLSLSSGGLARYTSELSLALARCFSEDEFILASDQPFEMPPGPPVNLLRGGGPRTAAERRWWLWGLGREAARQRVDVVHGPDFAVPYLSQRPSVMTLHDLSPWMDRRWHHAARRIKQRTPVLFGLGIATMVVTPSETVRKQALERFRLPPEQVVAVPEAAPPWLARVETPPSRPYFLFVGTLEPRKNLGTLLKAFAQMIRETPLRPQLVVAGGAGWLMDETFVIMQDPDIRERLCLTGYLHDDDLRALYSSCRAFIYPSLYEGFGLPPLEAMATGAPVIASRAAALLETLGEAAILVDPLDVQGLSQAMVALLAAETRRAELIEKGRTQAAKFSWRRTAELTYDVYQRCVSAGRA